MQVNMFHASLAQELTSGGSETEIFLDKITTITGETISTSQFATLTRGILTIDPDADGIDRVPEFISFTAVDSGDTSVTGAIRGLSALSNTASTERAYYHPVGTKVVISVGIHNLLDILEYVDDSVAATVVGGALASVATAGETVAAGDPVYLKNDGKWWKTDASSAATAEGVQLGIAQGAGTADAAITNGVLTRGLDSNQTGLVAGTDYYLSDTAGEISDSAGTVPKLIGRARSTTQIYFDPTIASLTTDDEKNKLTAVSLPGLISPYAGSSAPTGWLLCNGDAVSRTTYASLFAVVSTSYGVGDGSTTFNVPDLRGSIPLGAGTRVRTMVFDGASAVDPSTDIISVTSNDWLHTGQAVALTGSSLPTGLSATTYYVIRNSATAIKLATSVANANAGTAVDITADGVGDCTLTQTLTARTVGDNGGEETHALTDAQMPSHNHRAITSAGAYQNIGSPTSNGSSSSTGIVNESANNGNGTNTAKHIEDTGSDTPHNILSPYTVIQYIIKT